MGNEGAWGGAGARPKRAKALRTFSIFTLSNLFLLILCFVSAPSHLTPAQPPTHHCPIPCLVNPAIHHVAFGESLIYWVFFWVERRNKQLSKIPGNRA